MSRVVMFVFTDCTSDGRVLREAATLAAAGHAVTVMARTRDPWAVVGERELREGFEIVRVPAPQAWRYLWTGLRYPWRAPAWLRERATAALRRGRRGAVELIALALGVVAVLPWVALAGSLHLILRAVRGPHPPGGDVLDWLVRWRFGIRGWARAAERAAPLGDVYHAHDLSGLLAVEPARLAAGALLVYDSHELFLESGLATTLPRWARDRLAGDERGRVARAAALVTVNDSIAAELGRRYRPRRTVVIHNCPPRWTPPEPRPDLLRAAAGIPRDAPVVLYHGGFWPERGLFELAAAAVEEGLERVHVVYLGHGAVEARLREAANDPRYAGRLHVLPAVPLDRLEEWVASADVGAMPNQPVSLNELYSTPNKLFECLAAGTPVVASDFPERRRIVCEDPVGPLGEVCDPADPRAIARAIRAIIELPPADYADLRARCLRAAHERWNWETEGSHLAALYADLGPPTAG